MTDTTERYPVEILDEDADDGTIVENVDTLRKSVVGRKIVRAEKVTRERQSAYSNYTYQVELFEIELDNGKVVQLAEGGDCCAYTGLDTFLLNVDKIDHAITGVGTTDEYTKWHIFADMGDVLELTVDWSPGNPFYYSYGFDIEVVDA